jgi:hypothetical protein
VISPSFSDSIAGVSVVNPLVAFYDFYDISLMEERETGYILIVLCYDVSSLRIISY